MNNNMNRSMNHKYEPHETVYKTKNNESIAASFKNALNALLWVAFNF